jgi:hypothetical protein
MAARMRRDDAIGLAALAAWVMAWLWPIGAGGRMPVGGDVTQFQIGLMGEYDRALAEGRLPLWNANWGFGFPGLAESQMGVYYPPHVVLYGLFNTETAYTISLVAHLIWAAWGTYWLARVLGVSAVGAFLAGVAWSASGFSLIHLSHQWAYTVGSWMPWAWGLAWRVGRGAGGLRSVLGLGCVLAVQVLPGHFQLAFITQVTSLVLGLAALLGRRDEDQAAARWLRCSGLLLAVALVLPLSACQLWPTWQLARRAETDRTFEYLSGFATHWLHLVSYVAPGLFHWSPLWRSIVWDPLRTSPEEHLGYVGLVPLALALAALVWGWRRDRVVRTLMIVGLVSLYLSLGPNVPGFDWLIRLPGFSFFRAPARWGSATMLAGAVLAGVGLDRVGRDVGARRVGIIVGGLSLLVPLLVVGVMELGLALTSTRPPAWIAEVSRLVGAPLPVPPGTVLDSITKARQPSDNPIVIGGLRRQGMSEISVFAKERGGIYLTESIETAGAGLILLVAIAVFPKRRAVPALVLLTLVDLTLLGRHREVEDAPLRPLVEQSPVLIRLAEVTRETGGRSLDPFGNLGMVAGAAPVLAYRTLDLEAAGDLVQALRGEWPSSSASPGTPGACRFADVRVLAAGPLGEGYGAQFTADEATREEIEDPALSSWLYGRRYAGDPAVRSMLPPFVVRATPGPSFRAWRLADAASLDAAFRRTTDGRLLALHLGTRPALREPIPMRREAPERMTVGPIEFGPGSTRRVVIVELVDPEWEGTWEEADGRSVAAAIGATGWTRAAGPLDPGRLGGLILVDPPPGPGQWTLHLRYEGRAARQGLAVSIAAWAAWLAAWRLAGRGSRTARREPRQTEPPLGTSVRER